MFVACANCGHPGQPEDYCAECGNLIAADSPDVAVADALRRSREGKAVELPVMTVTPARPFIVICPVFSLAADTAEEGKRALTGLARQVTQGLVDIRLQGSPDAAFRRAAEDLWDSARDLGADAVIGAHFDYRVAHTGSGIAGGHQTIEFFAYGTAVRWANDRSEKESESSPAATTKESKADLAKRLAAEAIRKSRR